MSCPFSEQQLSQLKVFVELCKNQPQIIHHPNLSFFKDYLVSLGVSIPTATYEAKNFAASGDSSKSATNDNAPEMFDDESEPESDVELDMDGVIEGDSFCSQEMGDENKEVTDDDRDQSDEKRSEAMRAFSEQQFDEAIVLYTQAILLNPQSSLLFAKRGQVFLKQNKLHACIKDCTRALELNCDSAAAYKFRGRAYRLLGKFEEACHDLCESLKIDYDDQANEWLHEVKPNAEKLRQHKLSVQRKKEDKEHREKLRRARKAQEAHEKAAQEKATRSGAEQPPDLSKLFSDPEVLAAMEDPEVMKAFYDVSANPSNFFKYQNNPKVAATLETLKKKFNQFTGPTEAPASGNVPKAPADDDVGLD